MNVLLLLVLGAVWVRNHLAIRSEHTLGALVFTGLLLAENPLALYYYLTAITLPASAVRPMLYLQVPEAVVLAALTYVTVD